MNRWSVVLAITAALILGGRAEAQETECYFSTAGRTERVTEFGVPMILAHDPFVVTCTDGAELRANSGRINEAEQEFYLLGDVFFQDLDRALRAREATYSAATARLWAQGDVEYENRVDRSTLRGPELEYFRATEERPESQMTATRRPTLTLPPREGTEETEPLELEADRVIVIGENDLSAFGNVVITRSDLLATSGEARYNTELESLELRDSAHIESDEFVLTGDVVQAQMIEGALQDLRSRTNATLQGEDLRVESDELRLFFQDDLLQRAVASSPGEGEALARAISATFRLEADSLDANFVDQRLEEVYAIGRARGESIDTTTTSPTFAGPDLDPSRAIERDTVATDTAASALLASDWIRGDTIIGYFEPLEPVETAFDPDDPVIVLDPAPVPDDEQPPVELRRLVAIGAAQSLYRIAPREGTNREQRDLNFLVGDRIELELADGELEVAQVTGLQRGVYLEAAPVDPIETEVEPEANEPADVQPEVIPAPNANGR